MTPKPNNRAEDMFPLRFYMNLGRRDDRRREVEYHFYERGLEVERFPAIHARYLRSELNFERHSARAIAMTTRAILREAERRDAYADAVLIFEDDVVLAENWRQTLENVDLPDDWGILYLGCTHETPPEPITEGLLRVSKTRDTQAWAVRRPYWRLVRKLLQGRETLPLPPQDWHQDAMISLLHEMIPSYACWPNLAWQRLSHSNNWERELTHYSEDGNQLRWRHAVAHLPLAMFRIRSEKKNEQGYGCAGSVPPDQFATKGVLSVRLQGGFGNQLFQYAAGLALARHCQWSLQLRDGGLGEEATPRAFSLGCLALKLSPCPAAFSQEFVVHGNYSEVIRKQKYLEAEQLPSGMLVSLHGDLQNEAWFHPVRAEIRMLLTEAVQQQRAEFYLQGRFQDRKIIGVHIRRGDYVNSPTHAVCDVGYFWRGLRIMNALLPGAEVLVFSDDIEWARQKLFGKQIHFHEASGDDFRDWCILSACQGFVISNSTWSWWAAWRAGNVPVICPKPWLPNREWCIVPDEWVMIPGKSIQVMDE